VSHPIPDAALDSDIAIIARKGSGKSYLARGLAERLLDLKRRLVIIDPLGAWWGLKASADGESAGYPVAVFGGEHGDMPLTSKMGEPLAKLIASENLPCVIDTSLMRKEEQGELAIDLFEGLFRFNKDALTIVLEEADVFAPQNPAKDGYAARVLHEVDRIARRGRARGLRLISLTQRPARLHKDVLSQAAALVAMRLTSPHDRAAIEDWIKGNADASQAKEVMGSLATLAIGEGWVWAPDLDILRRAKFPSIKTLDTSATPKAGERRIAPKTLAEVDVSAIREALAVPAPVSKENLKRDETSPALIEQAEQRGYHRGWQAGVQEGRKAGWNDAAEKMRAMLADFLGRPYEASPVPDVLRETEAKVPAQANGNQIAEPSPGVISPSALAMLDTLVICHPWPIPAILWGAFSGRSPVSGPWHKAVSELKATAFVETADGKFVATPAGVSASKSRPAGIGSDVDLWRCWRATIRGLIGESAIGLLEVLSAHRPNRLTARQWGLLTNRSPISGPWHGALKALSKWDCIEKSGDRYGVTEKGVQIAGNEGGADTREALFAVRVNRLSTTSRQIFDALPGERTDLARKLGKSPISGPWHSAIKELLASGLAAETARVIVRIDEELEALTGKAAS
jgi:hypothetical protein